MFKNSIPELPAPNLIATAVAAALRVDTRYRTMAFSRAAVAALALSVATPSSAGTFTVTNTNDSGQGSLRQAVINTNASAGPDDIVFDSVTGTIAITSGPMNITESVSINGPGADELTVQGDSTLTQDMFTCSYCTTFLNPADDIHISGLTITGARAAISAGMPPAGTGATITIDGCQLVGNQFGVRVNGNINATVRNSTISGGEDGLVHTGDFIYSNGGLLAIENSTVSGNRHIGVTVRYSAGTEITDSTIASNVGPGVFGDYDVSVKIVRSTITGNGTSVGIYGPESGGGIWVSGPFPEQRVIVHDSTINDNTGGGITFSPGGNLELLNSTVSGNTAVRGGGINLGPYNRFAQVFIEHSTITGNHAEQAGGILGFTWQNISTASQTIRNTIVAGNTATVSDPDIASTAPFDADFNLIQDPGTVVLNESVAGSNLLGEDAKLQSLADNGGRTQTHRLLADSPAINRGDPSFSPPPEYDQRGEGFNRVTGSQLDIGAFEVQASDVYALRSVGDINGDTTPEVAVVVSSAVGTAIVVDAASGASVSRFAFNAGDVLVDVEAISDINSNGAAELALLRGNSVAVEVRDTLTGELVNTVNYAARFSPIDLAAVDDANGNLSPELAVLGRGSLRAQVRDALSGFVVNDVYYNPNFDSQQLIALPDIDNSGSGELGVLSLDNPGEGSDKIEIRDLATRQVVSQVWLGNYFTARQVESIADRNGNGSPELVVLREREPENYVNVLVADSKTAASLKQIGFNRNFKPIKLIVINDLNENGAAEIGVLGVDRRNGNVRVEIRDSRSGDYIKAVYFNKEFVPQDIVTIDDVSNNNKAELVVLGRRASDGLLRLLLHDALTGARFKSINIFP